MSVLDTLRRELADSRLSAIRWTIGALLLVIVFGLSVLAPGLRLLNGNGELEPGDIVVLSGKDDSIGGQRNALVDEWNALHPENQARIVEVSSVADAQHAEMVARAQAGTPDVDVYNLDVTWTAEFAAEGYVRPIEESTLRAEDFLERPMDSARYFGRLWAVPFNTDVGLLYYRKDVLRDVIGRDTPPVTWDALRDDVQAARQSGRGPSDFVGQFADYEGLTANALEVIRGAGGQVIDSDGDVVVRDDIGPVKDALGLLRDVAPDVPAYNEAESTQAFQGGQALFMRNWPLAYRTLTQAPEQGQKRVEFGVAPLPSDSGVLGGQNLAISTASERPRAARALIDFLTSDRSQQLLLERGGLPATRRVVYNDRDVATKFPFLSQLRDALERAEPRPVVPHYERFSTVFRQGVNCALRGQDGALPADFEDRLNAAVAGRLVPDDVSVGC